MLLQYVVSNFKSIGHPVEFSMFPIEDNADKRFLKALNTNQNGTWEVLRRGGFFGPNASGKSSFIESIAFARDFIVNGRKSGRGTRVNQFKGDFDDLKGISTFQHRIKGFSRGMKQRLGIAQALLNSPKLLICDEPTSALDPVGRKEILDILLTVREQTTVLFSTHILSDVERICTDVAFLNNGVVETQGKLSDIKTRYRSEEYLLETENDADIRKLIQAFPSLKQMDRNQLTFCESVLCAFDVLRFVSEQHIALLKFERVEPTLESLFMEVTQK